MSPAEAEAAGDASVASLVIASLAELADNAPADAVLARLRQYTPESVPDPEVRARLLRARAIAANRLGFPSEALGDLLEARRLLLANPEPRELVEVLRTIALVHSWRGDGREAALSLLQAAAVAGTRADELAAILIEAGRLHIEIGRFEGAELLLRHALELAPAELPPRERERAGVNLVQVLVSTGRLEEARERLATLLATVPAQSQRVRFLLQIEAMRIAAAAADYPAARAALAAAAELVEPDPDSFPRVELAHAEAELALAEGDAAGAEPMLAKAIARYADTGDDLAPREIAARLLQARVFEALSRPEDRDRTLAAALRRALARGLVGYVDTVRGLIAERGEGAAAAADAASAAAVEKRDPAARFVRRRRLGAGGFGTAERAYDLELGIEVALKRIPFGTLYDVEERRRLLDSARLEVAAASRVQHPGIVRIHGVLIDDAGEALVVEELIEGATLRAVMGNALPPARALDLLAKIAFALAALHAADIVHRDVKPENVIMRDPASPVLIDFGVAVVGAHGRLAMAGTPGYMAPEQRRGARIDGRADLYALGAIAHQMLLGRPWPESENRLFGRRRARRAYQAGLRAAGVDTATATLLAALLAPNRRRRPSAAAAVAAQLARGAALAAGS
ncbi:MAG TPA: serine/threonine-protein kinase [Stellaceae bacterium]|nr:serine/threonine-protein kinase [Stellaceae bacterium]